MKFYPIAIVAALSACTVGPNYTAPQSPPPQTYLPAGETGPAVSVATNPTEAWWTLFRSPRIDQLMSEAEAANPTLAVATDRLAEAQDEVAAATGGLYPQASFSGGIGRDKINVASYGFKGANPVINFYSLGPSVSYALDIFGGTKRRIESLTAQAEAQRQQLAAAHLVLSGNVVTAAATVAAARAQLAALDDIVANDQHNLNLVEMARAGGTATQVDVLSAQSQLASDQTLLPPIRQQLSVARHALATFVGAPAGDWLGPDFELTDFAVTTAPPLVIPSALVHRRPDILAAEATLRAANADVGVATAQLYPSITITASIAQGATDPSMFFSGASSGWNLGAGLFAPIFNGGTLRAKKRAAIDRYNAALARYRETVLEAFDQVADRLTALDNDTQEIEEQGHALDASNASLSLAQASYRAGQAGILQVLDAERQYQQARLGIVRSQAQRLTDIIALLVETGSGWRPAA